MVSTGLNMLKGLPHLFGPICLYSLLLLHATLFLTVLLHFTIVVTV
jgi:hypothetical protein